MLPAGLLVYVPGMGGLNVLAPAPAPVSQHRGRGRGRGRPSKQPKSSKLFIEDADATAEPEVDPVQKRAIEDCFLVSKVFGKTILLLYLLLSNMFRLVCRYGM